MRNILREVLSRYWALDREEKREGWQELTEEELWLNLCVCLLSSQVPYELALSAVRCLAEKGLLDVRFLISESNAEPLIEKELSKRQFEPMTKSCRYRRYRFPATKARGIVRTAINLFSQNESLHAILDRISSDLEARQFLIGNVDGFGMKQASHFLRNIGYTNRLAIIDTHIIAFLKECGLVEKAGMQNGLTSKRYLDVERVFNDFAGTKGLDPGILDHAVWSVMRERRK